MNSKEQDKSNELVPIGKSTLAKYSSELAQRGLALIDAELDIGLIRLLIVDDIGETRERIRLDIEPAKDIRVVGEARDGQEAVKLYDELKPDVVCMNINMRYLNGIEATEVICRKHKDAAIFIHSVQSDADYMRRAMNAGALDFLAKPQKAHQLLDTIRKLAGQPSLETVAIQESTLQNYLAWITAQFIHGESSSVQDGENIKLEASARTLSVLRSLGGERKGKLLQFLHESDLIKSKDTIINLAGADLSFARLREANLKSNNLEGVNMRGADLSLALLDGTKLVDANLSGADLSGASLRKANLRKAVMQRAHLNAANLFKADLRESLLDQSYLHRAECFEADMRNASFRSASLDGCKLRGANLSGAIFTGLPSTNKFPYSGTSLDEADFTDARVSSEQLERAKSLRGTRMPDGSIHN